MTVISSFSQLFIIFTDHYHILFEGLAKLKGGAA